MKALLLHLLRYQSVNLLVCTGRVVCHRDEPVAGEGSWNIGQSRPGAGVHKETRLDGISAIRYRQKAENCVIAIG